MPVLPSSRSDCEPPFDDKLAYRGYVVIYKSPSSKKTQCYIMDTLVDAEEFIILYNRRGYKLSKPMAVTYIAGVCVFE